MRSRAFASFLVLASLPLLSLFAGCGSRTGLLGEGEQDPVDASPGRDARIDSRRPDAADVELPFDALPPIDVRPPPIDGNFRSNCPDAGATLIYVVTQTNDLYSFYPPDLAFTRVGTLACPTSTTGATPFSMTVDRKGIAYVVFTNGDLFRVSTATAACATTTFTHGQHGFTTFGMGYAANTNDPGETLFVAQNDLGIAGSGSASGGLGMIDTATMSLEFIGPFFPRITPPELTGTADGRLFAWTPDPSPSTNGSHLYEIDKGTSKVLAENRLAVGSPNNAFAFAHWGGQFWIFTGTGGPSTVTRFDPSTNNEADVATLGQTIVGAGVSTCAPSP